MANEKVKKKILVIDDEAHQRKLLKMVLEPEGFEVDQADDGDVAVEMAKSKSYQLALLDLKMKRMSGIETLEALKNISPDTVVIIMTAFASVETAVKAMKIGAIDYLAKPLDIDELKQVVAKAIGHTTTEAPEEDFKRQFYEELGYEGVIGSSKLMHSVFKDILQVAKSDATVIIYGESGTGKELIARAIHKGSKRKGSFVTVNCGALTESLLESELFGIKKGVATGVTEREGKFALAEDGTIFLDEVGDMSPNLQIKVLRVLQEREFEKVGSTKTIKVNVQILAASNKDLLKEMKAGRFREDLYYRLNVVPIFLPTLQERKEDVPELANFFLKKYSQKSNKAIRGISEEAMNIMLNYDWPGNIRQLENSIERAVIMTLYDKIEPENLPAYLNEPPVRKEKDVNLVIKDVERELIIRALEETGGNKTQAAKLIGISRRTLFYKIKEYDID